MLFRSLPTMTLIVALTCFVSTVFGKDVVPPPNAPAAVQWRAATGELTLEYHGTEILSAAVTAKDAGGKSVAVKFDSKTDTDDEKVEQTFTFTPVEAKEDVTLVLAGMVTGSEEAFSAETLSAAQERFPCVRNSVGLSRNLRNNAVYDRRWDWVLIGPTDGATRIEPKLVEKQQIAFSLESRGSKLEIIFRPRFYQKHKDLKYYQPWRYKVWEGSVSGYCSWWAYKGGFNQEALDDVVDALSAKRLPDFGYRYVQFDDCYQSGNGSPEGWLKWNGRFPGGPKRATERIRSAGMNPGIWVHCVLKPNDPKAELIKMHPEWVVHDADGKPFVSKIWAWSIDANNEEALERLVRPTHRGLKKLGFEYVKIDFTQHLLNDGYRQCPDYFEKIRARPDDTLRKYLSAAREELGRDVYVLNCLGVRPEAIGIVDGSRLGGDGFKPQLFEHYNTFNGVVWRNDPDHCDLVPRKEGDIPMRTFAVKDAPRDTIVRPCIVSMAGGVLMLSDKAEVYRDERNLEGARRSSPVLFTVPGQLYTYDERSPRGCPWWLLEIDRPFDHWTVLARFNWRRTDVSDRDVKFADLGLHDDREYLVFEFWSQTFVGKSKGSFTAPAQDANNGVQVFAIRESRPHPWILSTTRHISQGGVSLSDVQWDEDRRTLTGKSAVVVDDPYVPTIHLPDGFRLESAEVGGEEVEIANQEETATVRIVPSATRTVQWKMTFAE